MFEELMVEALVMVLAQIDKPEAKTAQRVVYEKQIETVTKHVSDKVIANNKLEDESTYVVTLAHGTMETEIDGIPVSPRFGEFERAMEGLAAQEYIVVKKIEAIKEEVKQSALALQELYVLAPQLKAQAYKNMNLMEDKVQTYTEWGSAAGNIIVTVATAALVGVTAPVTIATAVTGAAAHAYIVYGS